MIASFETEFLTLMALAVIVAIITRRIRFPYTIALVCVGFAVSAFKGGLVPFPLDKEMIFFLFLPPLLFEGSVHIHLDDLKENKRTISILAVFGLIISVGIIGVLLNILIGIPLIYALLFGSIISATDPVSVLALFKKLGVSKKLSAIVEGESLFNDGTGVVIFQIILGLALMGELSIWHGIVEFLKVVLGGAIVGASTGFIVYSLMKKIDDHLIEVMSTIILAYGAFILAEHFHFSGVIAVVTAGLLIGNYGRQFAMSPTTRIAIVEFWEIIVFCVNSLIFIMIGFATPLAGFPQYGFEILVSIVVVLIARSVSVHSISYFTNFFGEPTPISWQLVINWGGLRGSIPVALILGLQHEDIPYKELITYMTFGFVAFSMIVQGLTVSVLLKKLNLVGKDDDENEANLLFAKKATYKIALRDLKQAHDEGNIAEIAYEKVKADYMKLLEEVRCEYQTCIANASHMGEKHEKIARKVGYMSEKSATIKLLHDGYIDEDSGKEMLGAINRKLESVE